MKQIKFILNKNENDNYPTLLLRNNEIVDEVELSGSEMKIVIKEELKDDKLIDQVRLAAKLFRARSIKLTKKYNY